jgi:hypothetical protein
MGSGLVNGLKVGASNLARSAAIGAAVRAVDRRVRGFGKWFGRVMNVASITGFVRHSESDFAAQLRQTASNFRNAIFASPQRSGGGGSVVFGELKVVGQVTASSSYSSLVSGWVKNINLARVKAATPAYEPAPAPNTYGLGGPGTTAAQRSAAQGARFQNSQAYGATLRAMTARDMDRNLLIIAGTITAPAVVYGVFGTAPLSALGGPFGGLTLTETTTVLSEVNAYIGIRVVQLTKGGAYIKIGYDALSDMWANQTPPTTLPGVGKFAYEKVAE